VTIIEQQIVICCFRFGCIRRVYQSFDIPPFEIENILQCYYQTQLSFTFWWQFIQNRLYANAITRYLVNCMGHILLWVLVLSRDSFDGCFRGQWNTLKGVLASIQKMKKSFVLWWPFWIEIRGELVRGLGTRNFKILSPLLITDL